jgi:predicted acyltransferase
MTEIDIAQAKKSNRWIALDFLRGLTIAAMIVVNNPGDWSNKYDQLGHAEWHGITFPDFVFPFFIFIVGVSIALALSRQLDKNTPTKLIYRKVIKRTIILFLFGLLLSLLSYPMLGGFRVAGVLQRIALAYFFSSIVFLNFSWKNQIIITLILLIGYWLLLALVPVPGLGYPSVEPVNNLASWFDRKFLPGLLFNGNHDPEGILSTIPAVASGLIGVLIGQLSIKIGDKTRLNKWLWGIGILMLIIGIIWQFSFPLNKNLWTSSFVLVTGGAAILTLAITTWIVDVKDIKYGISPFIVFGSNAITSYMLSFVLLYLVTPQFFGEGRSMLKMTMNLFMQIGFSAKFSALLWALFFTFLCYIPVHLMYKRGIFLKV